MAAIFAKCVLFSYARKLKSITKTFWWWLNLHYKTNWTNLLQKLTSYVSTESLHLHLQSGEHSRFALAHLHPVQSPLQEHLISSLHALETSRIVIHTGTHDWDINSLVHANSCGEGNTWCVCVQVVQIQAWYNARWVCWSSASCVGGILSIDLLLWQKSSSLASFTELKGLVLSYIMTISLSIFWKWRDSDVQKGV